MPNPITKHHAEWLSLLEISGPFLSMPVLLNAFPQGLDDYPSTEARSLRADYEFCKENTHDPAVYTAWIRLVLETMLGYSDQVLITGQAIPAGWRADFPEHEETLRPDVMIVEPGTQTPHLLIQVYPPGQSLEKAPSGSHWQASIATRMMELLHATEIRLGLVTNGEQWMLVDAPRGETTGFTTWIAGLWFDEPITLRAFRSLLGVQRFFGVAADQTLESLLAASAQDQQEITDQLGLQVRHAVEILIQMIDRADQDSGGKLLGKDVPPSLLYEAALTVMMRLVFMLSAEERKLLPLDDSLYYENYAVSTLRAQLRELADQQGEEVLERRFDAWSRLLAAFRAVYGGIHHERLTLPPYGSSLFDPDKYPFLEGRVISVDPSPKNERGDIPLPVNNRTVLHLLDALQILQVSGEARRLSFRALDVEQIGHVYEGLLDHVAVRAAEVVVGLRGAKRQEPEIALSALEQAAKKKEADFLTWLNDQTGRSPSALKNALASDILQKNADFANRLRAAAGNDEHLMARLTLFAGLLRTDDFGFPVVILPGSVYVTQGTTRRATGTHYTPRSLTEPIVQHTLEPLVYIGPAEGLPKEQWTLRTPAELLDLKICDMAMGSAGFLVQVIRFLSERLVEVWDVLVPSSQSGRGVGSEVYLQITPEGKTATGHPSETIIPRDGEERLILARRLIADRCIYGVDKNPLAVEIAKLSIWLTTMDKGRPFTFLNHALKCGDSLVGVSEGDFLRWAHGWKAAEATLFDAELLKHIEMAREKRRALEAFTVRDVRDAEQKAELLKEAEAGLERVKLGCDLLVGSRLIGLSSQEAEELQLNLLFPYMAGQETENTDAQRVLTAAKQVHAFHWQFEFPEVFYQGGFNALVGNPPFIGGRRIRENLGDYYREILYSLYQGSSGNADYCVFFFLKGFECLRKNGCLGLLATNTISEGDSRRTGLENIVNNGGQIIYALNDLPWPGSANVIVSVIHIYKGHYPSIRYLDGNLVSSINSLLSSEDEIQNPLNLMRNKNISYQGSVVVGMGFVLSPEEAEKIIKLDKRNAEVIKPYLNGDDINTSPTQTPSRCAINFYNWPLEKAEIYQEPMKIIREKVYPIRMSVNREAHRRYWWHYGDKRPALYDAIYGLRQILVTSRISKHLAFVFVPNGWVYNEKTFVLPFDEFSIFTLLQSTIHNIWAWKFSSTLGSGLNYAPTDCLETFAFPKSQPPSSLDMIGKSYHEHRHEIMLTRQEGLTSTYNRFHNLEEKTSDIVRLRELHVEMDHAVAAAYGWQDLDLGHSIHETAQGLRYTISEVARREVLGRLLQLNHERYEEEMKIGLHEKKKAKASKEKKGKSVREDPGQYGLF